MRWRGLKAKECVCVGEARPLLVEETIRANRRSTTH